MKELAATPFPDVPLKIKGIGCTYSDLGTFTSSFLPQIAWETKFLETRRERVRHKQNIFIDPIVSVRKKAEKRDRHEERERKKERDVSASTP